MKLELDANEINEALTQYVGSKFDLSNHDVEIHLQGPRGDRGAGASITLTKATAQKESVPGDTPPKQLFNKEAVEA